MSRPSVKNGIFIKIWLAVLFPNNVNTKRLKISKVRAQENQFEIKGVLMFWTFKSDHLEFRNTLPNLAKVDLYLLFRSKKILKYDKKLELCLGLLT